MTLSFDLGRRQGYASARQQELGRISWRHTEEKEIQHPYHGYGSGSAKEGLPDPSMHSRSFHKSLKGA
jgi:hypothetical protein